MIIISDVGKNLEFTYTITRAHHGVLVWNRKIKIAASLNYLFFVKKPASLAGFFSKKLYF